MVGRAIPGAIIARAKAGDPEAFGELYDCYAPGLYGIALRLLGSPADAEDVVQDVFLELPRALLTYESRGSFGGWLSRIGARRALIKLRRAKVAARYAAARTPRGPPPRPVGAWIERITLQTAIDRLPGHLRAVFVLREIAGYSHVEIAEMEAISVANSRARLCRARERLRSLLWKE